MIIKPSNRRNGDAAVEDDEGAGLFLFLLQHRGQQLRKSAIVELLWPEMEPERAFSQLYTTIYHIRKTLKKYHDHFKIENSAEAYTLRTQNLLINIDEWERGIQVAPPLTLKTIGHYSALMELNCEIYLKHYDYLWAETERQRLERLWLKAAFEIADCYHEHG